MFPTPAPAREYNFDKKRHTYIRTHNYFTTTQNYIYEQTLLLQTIKSDHHPYVKCNSRITNDSVKADVWKSLLTRSENREICHQIVQFNLNNYTRA
jgi:hypothetical protein